MALTATQEEFLKLFREYMVRHDRAYKPLSDFMKTLSGDKVRHCLSSYLDVFAQYNRRDKHSLRIFYELALLGIKDDVYFAVRYDVLASTPGKLYFERNAALDKKQ